MANETSRHPEQQDDEALIDVVFHNVGCTVPRGSRRTFETISYATKRLGSAIYGSNGKPVVGYKPVFVKHSEIEEQDRQMGTRLADNMRKNGEW